MELRARLIGALLGLLLAAPAAAGQWVYPLPERPDASGHQVFPTSDGRRFMSAFEREEYLRQNREVMMAPRAARAAAARSAAEAGAMAEPPRPVPLLPPAATGDARRDRQAEEREARRHARQEQQRLLQWRLSTMGPADAARTRAAIAAAEAERSARVAAGVDRLRRGAAAARTTLGDREARPRGPLIRVPRVVLD